MRHYSTIGIEDVFIEHPPHPLPIDYTKSATESFASWEITADIKASPDDFVVREIRPKRDNDPEGLPMIAELQPIDESLWKVAEGTEKTKVNSASTVAPRPLSATDPPPMQVVEEQLAHAPPETLQSIRQLDAASRSFLAGTTEAPAPFRFTAGLELNRGVFHRAMRRLFPLLLAESRVDSSQAVFDITRDTIYDDLIASLEQPAEDLPRLLSMHKSPYDPATARQEHVALRLMPTLPREDRRPIHQLIDTASKSTLQTKTVTDNGRTLIVVGWSKAAARFAGKKRKRHQETPLNDRPHTLVVVQKRGVEHLTAIHHLTAAFKCRQADLGLAGIKDMQAVTFQFCTLKDYAPHRLRRANERLADVNMKIGTVHRVDWFLKKGDLQGNRFELVLRNVQRIQVDFTNGVAQESRVPCDEAHMQNMVDRIRKHGFLNYYGEQRLGTPGEASQVGVRSFDIGRTLAQQDFAKAVDLFMTGRLICRTHDVENEETRKVRMAWKESGGDPFVTWKALPKGSSLPRERLVLKGLKRYGADDPLAAWRCLHYNERTFYISAYQSFVWNAMASHRIEKYGTRVVEGDLILQSDGSVRLADASIVATATIADVVLPHPGYGIQYPSNEIGDLYQQMLQADGVSFEKDAPLESTATGSYRSLVVTPDNLSFEMDGANVKLLFDLPRGCYATMLLRELMLTTVVRDE